MNFSLETISWIGGGLASVAGAAKGFKFVKEGEKGIKLRFGKAVTHKKGELKGQPQIIEPGFVWLIPFVDTMKTNHVRQQSYRFPEQRIMLKDGLVLRVGGMAIYRVSDIYKCLFEIESVDRSIDDLCMAAIKEELEKLTYDELAEKEDLSETLKARVKDRAAEWGLEIIQVSLPECAPTPEAANIINARLGVKLRLDALKECLDMHGMNIKTVNPNFAAVLVGIPLTATVNQLKADDNWMKDNLGDYPQQVGTPEG